ncbi:hypothetical protein [Hymenobacter crusticola]|uniref:hypothetical protein n=1 Tax=Hymenobacter crusticola TaxID=1770526 RepID=UPI001179ADEA|nr:hypothetical protein [Hymenobacter crusticola]
MNSLLRYSLLCLSCFPLLVSCVSVDRVIFRPHSAAFENRLPNLELAIDHSTLDNTDSLLADAPQQLFQHEVTQNIVDPTDNIKFGCLKLTITSVVNERKGKGFQVLQMATLMAPSLLGVPLEYYRSSVRAQVQVINSHGKVLGCYRGVGYSTVQVALYHGYSQTNASRLADIDALRHALSQIRPQIEGVSDSLRTKLLAGGPMGPLSGATALDR